MTQQQQIAEGLALMIRAVNILLAAQNRPYRVRDGDIIMTRRDGFTFVAMPETRDAADWRAHGRAYSTMEHDR